MLCCVFFFFFSVSSHFFFIPHFPAIFPSHLVFFLLLSFAKLPKAFLSSSMAKMRMLLTGRRNTSVLQTSKHFWPNIQTTTVLLSTESFWFLEVVAPTPRSLPHPAIHTPSMSNWCLLKHMSRYQARHVFLIAPQPSSSWAPKRADCAYLSRVSFPKHPYPALPHPRPKKMLQFPVYTSVFCWTSSSANLIGACF